jgi:hypothetical protein
VPEKSSFVREHAFDLWMGDKNSAARIRAFARPTKEPKGGNQTLRLHLATRTAFSEIEPGRFFDRPGMYGETVRLQDRNVGGSVETPVNLHLTWVTPPLLGK